MKLNYKRTLLVGMAFFLISAFWQAYDAIIPLILTNHFGLPQTASGAVMSIDNVLAVFMLPIFGAISDKVNTKLGKRTPFIIGGTIAAVIAFIALTFIDTIKTQGRSSDLSLLSRLPNLDDQWQRVRQTNSWWSGIYSNWYCPRFSLDSLFTFRNAWLVKAPYVPQR